MRNGSYLLTELADVLSTIMSRIRGTQPHVPLVVSYDKNERVYNPAVAGNLIRELMPHVVLVKHSTESVASSYVKAGGLVRNHQGTGSGWSGRAFAMP
jgi:hypothetical protein